MDKRIIFAVGALALVTAGCKVSVESDPQAQQQAADAAKQIGAKSKELANSAVKAGGENAEATHIRVELGHAQDIDTSHVSVDVADKVIHIKGSVPDQKMKDRASQIAEAIKTAGYTVSNELAIKAKVEGDKAQEWQKEGR